MSTLKTTAAGRRSAVLLTLAGCLFVIVPAPAHADGTPYSDPQSSGALTFCDAQGHELRAGPLATHPFAAKTIASSAAPAGYTAGGTATLLGYQPRQVLGPSEWSGELLTGTSRYASARQPVVVGLPGDLSLGDLARDFPPTWDGLLQLRVYLGAPGRSLYRQRYDTADVRVTGDRWALVRGGGGDCAHAAMATAVSQILGVAAPAASPAPGASSRTSSGDGSATGAAQSAGNGSGSASSPITTTVADRQSSRGRHRLLWVSAGLASLVVAAAYLLRRKRSAHGALAHA